MDKDLTLIDALKECAEKRDNGITFISGKRNEIVLTYKELYETALQCLGYLQSRGLRKGQELIFQLDNCESFITTFWACLLGGIIPVPLTPGTIDEQKRKLLLVWKILKDPFLVTDKKTFIKISDYQDWLLKGELNQNVLEQSSVNSNNTLFIEDFQNWSIGGTENVAKSDDIAFIQFSSGSTGNPKGVLLTHRNIIINLIAINNSLKSTFKDSILSWLPLTHDMGLIGGHLMPIVGGISQFVMPTNIFLRHPLLWLEKASEHKVSFLVSPNFGYKYCLKFIEKENITNIDLSSVRCVINGAEPISVNLCNLFLDTLAPFGLKRSSMLTVYGMAEASVAVTFPPINENLIHYKVDRRFLNISDKVILFSESDPEATNYVEFVDLGYPIDDVEIRICDDYDLILEENHIGNIQIRGGNVTDGYYNNSDSTSKLKSADGWTRTGDIGFLKNRRLVFTGRKKDIIYVNGQNYYPQDLEKIAGESLNEPLSQEIAACGIYYEILQRDKILIFVTFNKDIKAFSDLANSIKKSINNKAGLVIDDILPIRKMPKTTSGKIQRFKLAQQYESNEFSDISQRLLDVQCERSEQLVEFTETEKKLIDIWQEVLSKEQIDIQLNFFEQGGNSLKATMLASRIHKEFYVEIPIGDIFNYLTIKAQAEYIEKNEMSYYQVIKPVVNQSYYATSSAQQRQFILNKIEGGRTIYNVPTALIISGPVNISQFEFAFQQLLERHEILRTSFEERDGNVVQRVHNKINFKVEFLDYQNEFSQIDSENNVPIDVTLNILANDFVRSFNLGQPPLFRVKLIKLLPKKYFWLIDIHHIIFDGSSYKALFHDFSLFYNQKSPPRLTIQYKDYAAWQNSSFESKRIKKQEKYWLQSLKGNLPILNFPYDYAKPDIQCFDGDWITVILDKAQTDKLRKLAAEHNTTLHTFLFAVYNVLLSFYTEQNDIIVGFPVAGRNQTELECLIGMFANTLALRNFCDWDSTFEEFLTKVKDNVLSAVENQDFPFELLLDKLQYKRLNTGNPLFDTVFILQNFEIPEIKIDGVSCTYFDIKRKITHFDFWIQGIIIEEQLKFDLEYCTKLFNKNKMQGFLNHFVNLLQIISENTSVKIGTIEILNDEEKKMLTSTFNSNKEFDFV